MLLISLVSVCCLISFLNMVFIILLSNSVFRMMVAREKSESLPPAPSVVQKGLVDLNNSLTYDTRFTNPRADI
jgi:hypothetical protein